VIDLEIDFNKSNHLNTALGQTNGQNLFTMVDNYERAGLGAGVFGWIIY
jgi:hypothetical protein